MIQKYGRYGLVVIDELGYVPFAKESAELMFQVLAERHKRNSVIITSNLGFADWTQVFGDATLTATLLDRLAHKAHIIACTFRRFALSLCKQEKTAKVGIKIKRKRAGWNNDYLLTLLKLS